MFGLENFEFTAAAEAPALSELRNRRAIAANAENLERHDGLACRSGCRNAARHYSSPSNT
jgi:hypothetical protein